MKQNTHLFAHVAISDGRGASSSTPRSPTVRRTVIGRVAASRSTVSVSRSSLAWNWKSIASATGSPLTARIRSPGRRPATAAAVRGRTAATTTPSLAQEDGLIPTLTLGDVGRVQVPHTLDDVLQPGNDRERGGDPDDGLQRHRLPPVEVAREETGEHGEDLEERRQLPRER